MDVATMWHPRPSATARRTSPGATWRAIASSFAAGTLWLPACIVNGVVGQNVGENSSDLVGDSSDPGGEGSGETTGNTGTTGSNQTSTGTNTPTQTVDTTTTSSNTNSNTQTSQTSNTDSSDTDSQDANCNPPSLADCPFDARDEDYGIACAARVTPSYEYQLTGNNLAIRERVGPGPGGFSPTFGDVTLILSTGAAFDIETTPATLLANGFCREQPVGSEFPDSIACPSSALASYDTSVSTGSHFLTPVDSTGVVDCTDDPSLVQSGDDCSNSLWRLVDNKTCPQRPAGNDLLDCPSPLLKDQASFDMRLAAPDNVTGFSFDFAFFTAEYPFFYRTTPSRYSDVFYAWLDSSTWHGNVVFDGDHNPVTVNSDFLILKDAANPINCPQGCSAPILAGTGFESHASTGWMTTTFKVVPGESFTLRLAIADLSYELLDSAVLLDNFRWSCHDGRPTTVHR